eukprot:7338575-Prorocentrum_lima.AAC.1
MSDLSTPRWFEVDPHLAWSFWRFRIEMYMRKSEPHEGYRILADWGESLPYGFFSVTSNIDGHWGRIIGERLTTYLGRRGSLFLLNVFSLAQTKASSGRFTERSRILS